MPLENCCIPNVIQHVQHTPSIHCSNAGPSTSFWLVICCVILDHMPFCIKEQSRCQQSWFRWLRCLAMAHLASSGIVRSLCCFTASALWPSPAVQSIFVPARRTPLQILLGSCRRPILEPLARLHHRLRRTAQTCSKLKPLLPSR